MKNYAILSANRKNKNFRLRAFKTEHSVNKIEQSDSSIEIIERSDSEDCCSRAEKTVYDEKGNQMKYFEAQEKIKNQIRNKSKKPALSNLPKISETKG